MSLFWLFDEGFGTEPEKDRVFESKDNHEGNPATEYSTDDTGDVNVSTGS